MPTVFTDDPLLFRCFFRFSTKNLTHVFNIQHRFGNYLTFSIPEKLKNSIFEMPIIPQTLNINKLRTTNAKSINLQIIRKLIEYPSKNVPVRAMFTLSVFEILLFVRRTVLPPAQQVQGTKGLMIDIISLNIPIQPLIHIVPKWLDRVYKFATFAARFLKCV